MKRARFSVGFLCLLLTLGPAAWAARPLTAAEADRLEGEIAKLRMGVPEEELFRLAGLGPIHQYVTATAIGGTPPDRQVVYRFGSRGRLAVTSIGNRIVREEFLRGDAQEASVAWTPDGVLRHADREPEPVPAANDASPVPPPQPAVGTPSAAEPLPVPMPERSREASVELVKRVVIGVCGGINRALPFMLFACVIQSVLLKVAVRLGTPTSISIGEAFKLSFLVYAFNLLMAAALAVLLVRLHVNLEAHERLLTILLTAMYWALAALIYGVGIRGEDGLRMGFFKGLLIMCLQVLLVIIPIGSLYWFFHVMAK